MSHIYNRFAFNTHGDMIAHLLSKESAYKSFPAKNCLMPVPLKDNQTVIAMRHFEEQCAAKGAKAFYCFAPVSSTYFKDPYNNQVVHLVAQIIKDRTNMVSVRSATW